MDEWIDILKKIIKLDTQNIQKKSVRVALLRQSARVLNREITGQSKCPLWKLPNKRTNSNRDNVT